MDGQQRAEKRYKYNTDPEIGEAVDKKTIETAIKISSRVREVSHEIAMYGYVLLMGHEKEIVIVNPDDYTLKLKDKIDTLKLKKKTDNGD